MLTARGGHADSLLPLFIQVDPGPRAPPQEGTPRLPHGDQRSRESRSTLVTPVLKAQRPSSLGTGAGQSPLALALLLGFRSYPARACGPVL